MFYSPYEYSYIVLLHCNLHGKYQTYHSNNDVVKAYLTRLSVAHKVNYLKLLYKLNWDWKKDASFRHQERIKHTSVALTHENKLLQIIPENQIF